MQWHKFELSDSKEKVEEKASSMDDDDDDNGQPQDSVISPNKQPSS